MLNLLYQDVVITDLIVASVPVNIFEPELKEVVIQDLVVFKISGFYVYELKIINFNPYVNQKFIYLTYMWIKNLYI